VYELVSEFMVVTILESEAGFVESNCKLTTYIEILMLKKFYLNINNIEN
jgi:hypothetical protein